MPEFHRLACHPASPSRPLLDLEARVERLAEGGTTLIYRLRGDLEALTIPAPVPAERQDGLWQHTCFEAFVRATGRPGYREFNFAPSGAWAAYAFTGYRAGMAVLEMPHPRIQLQRQAGLLELAVCLPAGALPSASPLFLGLSAVIEDRSGGLSYWSLPHPMERPDFHHPDVFTLELK